MWIALAAGSAIFAGLVAILAKAGIRHTPSNLATALRTIVVLAMAWLMVPIVGAQSELIELSPRTLAFLTLSGIAVGASWLCYFRALQLGPINPVVAVDRSSIVLTVVLGMLLFGEAQNLPVQLAGIALIAVGTYLMVRWLPGGASAQGSRAWIVYAIFAAIFASLTTVLAKIGLEGVNPTLATAVRTVVVLVMAWIVVLASGEHRAIRGVPQRELVFLGLSGIATGASWLCFFAALQLGPVSGVVPIDKLSVLVTAALAYLVFGERLSKRGAIGLTLIVLGTVALVV